MANSSTESSQAKVKRFLIDCMVLKNILISIALEMLQIYAFYECTNHLQRNTTVQIFNYIYHNL